MPEYKGERMHQILTRRIFHFELRCPICSVSVTFVKVTRVNINQMKVTDRENKKLIYAIKFKDLPFPEIDKFVCIPHSWIIHRIWGQKVLAAYPKNEAPFVTRNRTKNRERHSHDWRFYIGFIKFESENYEEVVKWIEEKIANGDDQDEEIEDPPVESRQLRSAKNPVLSGTLPEKPHLAMKPYDNPRRPLPKMLIRRPLPLRPWKPKPIESNKPVQPPVSSANTSSKEQSVIVENQQIQNDIDGHSKQTVDTPAQSPPKPADERQPSPKPTDGRPSHVQDEQLSIPDINDSNVEDEIEIEFEIIEEEKSPSLEQTQPSPALDHHYSLIESRLHEIHTGQPIQANDIQKTSLAENPTARPPSRTTQASQHHDVQPVSTPCSKQQGSVGTSSEVTHSCQNSVQSLAKTIPSTTYYTPNPIDLSFQQQIPAIRRKSSAAIKKPVEKKARLENVSKTVPTTQQSLYNKQLPNYAGNVGDQRHPVQSMNTAAQNLSHLAYQARFYDPSQLQYMQQIARMQGMINQPHSYMNQRSYFPNPMTGYVPHQANQINPSQFLSRQNQRALVSTNQMSELRRELIAPSVQSQPARNLENSQRQDLLSYQDPRTVNPLESQSNPEPQVAEEIPVVLQETNQQLSIDRRNNSRKDLLAKLSLGPIKFIEISPASEISQDSETQTTSELQEVQSEVLEDDVYLHPESEKQMADQVTEMEADQLKDGAPSPEESAESGYDTDKRAKEQEPQEVTDPEMVSADEELLDSVSSVGSEYANEDYSEDTSGSIIDETSIDVSNFVPDIQEKLSKIIEDEMLEVHGLLLTKMYKNFLNTEEYYNNLRVNTLGCLKLYEVLLNKAEKINVIESFKNSTSNVPEVQETPAPETPASEPNSTSDKNNNSSVDTRKNSPKKNKRRHTFVFPPEYDPNDSRWTLKHREPKPGLIELMPQSRVYVNKAELKNCIRSSNDCRMLARLLLTIVFSKNALSVCSPTGTKARAFNTVDIDVRPGLDEHARMVLLAFIEEYGNKRNWNTSDTAGIMSSIRTKIQEMRNKYGKKKVV